MSYSPEGRSYNCAELRDLIAAKDTEIANTAMQYQSRPANVAPDAAWSADWAKLDASYTAARTRAQRYVTICSDVPLLSLTDFDATYEYDLLLSSLNATWTQQTVSPGSLADLEGRLQTAYQQAGAAEPSGAPIPQPDQGADSGLGPSSWQAWMTGLGAKVGLVKDPPPGTPGTTGAPPLIPTWAKWVGGAGLVGAVALEVKTLFK